MKTSIRKAGVACGTAFASIALALSTATGASAANTAVMIGGIKIPEINDTMMKPLLEYAFKDQARVGVKWPAQAGPYSGKGDMTLGASIAQGIPALDSAITAALAQLKPGEKVTVVGLSAGSLVVNEVLRDWVTTNELPDPKDVTFIVVEDSSRQKLINDVKYSSKFDYTYQPPPITPYDVIVITGEYDGMADMPDRPFNFLAIMNAMAGSIVVHVPVMYTTSMSELAALEGTKYYTEDTNIKGGTTKHYLVPTATLPLVQLMPWLKPKEAELKAKIDKGYSRNDPVTATLTAAKTADLAPAGDSATETATEPASNSTGEEASSGQAQPAPKVDAQSRRDARAEARAEAKAKRAEVKAARAEARAAAKADAAAKREARKAAREEAKSGGADAPSDGSGSSDSSGSSE